MSDVPSESLSHLFEAIARGDAGAEEKLFELVYHELRKIAHGRVIRQKPGQTFQTTDLVNEAYLRMAGGKERKEWKDRQHFLRAAAQAMRHILVDRARKHGAVKHGGDQIKVPLTERTPAPSGNVDLVALDEALSGLARQNQRLSDVVQYRFFLGLTVAETAEVLGVAKRTVDSDWLLAKTWLRREMSSGFDLGEHTDGP